MGYFSLYQCFFTQSAGSPESRAESHQNPAYLFTFR